MGLYTQLPDAIQEVDVIIAGGMMKPFAINNEDLR